MANGYKRNAENSANRRYASEPDFSRLTTKQIEREAKMQYNI